MNRIHYAFKIMVGVYAESIMLILLGLSYILQ